MRGSARRWDPEAYLGQQYPDARLVETDLPPGLLGCVDHGRQLVFIARNLPEPQRRCTIAYELGQLRNGPMPNDPHLARARETAALDWAARQLIPSAAIAAAFAECYTIQMAAAWLDVDLPTVRARLRGLTDAEQDQVMSSIHHLHKKTAC